MSAILMPAADAATDLPGIHTEPGGDLPALGDCLPAELQHLPKITIHPDGVYFSLDEEAYHSDPALGSTDIKRLAESPAAYWWASILNPNRETDTDSAAKMRGRMRHCRLLEGDTTFRSRFRPVPRPDDLPTLLDTVDQIKARIREVNATRDAKDRIPLTGSKDELTQRLKAADPTAMFFADALAAYREGLAKVGGVEAKREDIADVERDAYYILSNIDVGRALRGGVSEVSVFWTEDGVRFKARIDLLKPFSMGDVKNIANTFDRPFDEVVHLEFARRRLDIQAVHYLAAWKHLKAAGAEGRVFGDCPFPYADWHTLLCAPSEVTFTWIFIQSNGAPITRIVEVPIGSLVFDRGVADVKRAKDTYHKCLAEFGLMKPWRDDAPVRVLQPSDLPRWFLRDGSQLMPVAETESVTSVQAAA